MNTLEKNVAALFEKSETVTTPQLCEAMYIKNVNARTVRQKSEKWGLGLEYVGRNTWVR